jgi:ribonuclease Z
MRPGVFHPERANYYNVPKGPAWSKLQAGESVVLENGEVIEPQMVLGEPRSGRKFSYVTDTVYVDTIASEVADSDLFICEGMFTDDLKESAGEKKHLTARQAAEIAVAAGGIKKMGLIHYSPRYTERDLKRLLKEAKELFPQTFLTRDGQLIPIPYEDKTR